MSMQRITWSTAYELGVEEIDLQHHYFANLINRLARELESTDDRHYQQRLFAELSAYAHFHFSSEENLMYRSGYPQLAEHKKHHDGLIEQLNIQKLMFEQSKVEAESVLEFLRQWFLKHTLGEDREFSGYLGTGNTQGS